MDFGKLEASAVSNTNELVVSAGYFNLDFSLVKFAAPPEYQGISGALSQLRRTEAEDGQSHITARRLGALFDGVCPPTPNLIKAYGLRATQIAQTVSSQDVPSKFKTNWIFSEYLGVDATSLWAAATSRKAALPIHLLACMLARIWGEAEAVSIWLEIVNGRRAELRSTFETEGELPFDKLSAASQADISQEQLAKWDSSARSWLRTADTVQKAQNDQLLLIIKNINLSVSNEQTTYKSIITAWTSALKTMESLIIGAPHVVQNSAVLLGISSWHLYPDMVYIGGVGGSKEISMKDPLVHPSGVMTMGVSDASGSRSSSSGIYWSLSLAHHRFYGRPETRTGEMDGHDHRLTFLQLQQATIGAILSHWKIPVGETDEALRMLVQLASFLLSDQRPDSLRYHWIRMITEPILEYFNDDKESNLAVALGRRRSTFIGSSMTRPHRPFWGLTSLNGLMAFFPKPEDQVELLRRLTRRSPSLQHQQCLLVARHNAKTRCYVGIVPDENVLRCWVPKRSPRALTSAYRKIGEVTEYAAKRFKWQSSLIVADTENGITYDYAFGEANLAATFVRRPTGLLFSPPHQQPNIMHDDLRWAIQHDMVSLEKLRSTIATFKDEIVYTLWLLSVAFVEYRPLSLEGATISPSVLRQPFRILLLSGDWLSEVGTIPATPSHPEDHARFDNDQGNCIKSLSSRMLSVALIAYLETGQDFLFRGYARILGLSVGNSLYVPRRILQDPEELERPSRFRRLLGNLATSGLTLLTCPETPLCRDLDISSWRQSTTAFDGTTLDHFNQTSLHLTLTDWSVPLTETSSVGQRHAGGTHREAVVSIRDAGSWVADIDPETALKADCIEIVRPSPCSCVKAQNGDQKIIEAQSLESWDQVLDCPEGILVTQSRGNWMARLALISVLAQHSKSLQKKVLVCPKEMCWTCAQATHRNAIFIA